VRTAGSLGVAAILIAMPLFLFARTRPPGLGVTASVLAPCPSSPNCVASDAADPLHHVAPLALTLPAGEAWHAARAAVASLPRTIIVTETDDYLHAECASRIFGFVDDLELHLRAAQDIIAVRSAARIGYSDLGVNRRRIETLRSTLAKQGVVR
jgi:uncharacterized protein (DUF1499 family)